MILLNAAAFLAGGKPMVAIFLFVLLAAYGIYLWYYPYIYIENTTKKESRTRSRCRSWVL